MNKSKHELCYNSYIGILFAFLLGQYNTVSLIKKTDTLTK